MADLAEINIEERADVGAKMLIMHPTDGKPLADDNGKYFFILLVGQDSTRYKNALRAQAQRMKRGKFVNQADAERRAIELRIACTLEWYLIENKEVVPFTAENAHRLYSEKSWICEQIDEFVYERSNFFVNA